MEQHRLLHRHEVILNLRLRVISQVVWVVLGKSEKKSTTWAQRAYVPLFFWALQ